MNKTKVCSKCKEEKVLSEFNKDRTKQDGLNSCCKVCHRKADKAWRENNADKVKQYQDKWKEANPEKDKRRKRNWSKRNLVRRKVYNQNRIAKKYKNGGSFTAKEWKSLCEKYDNRCLCCGEKERLTVDHVVPISKGGTSNIENIQPLCMYCNSSKGNYHPTDYRAAQTQIE